MDVYALVFQVKAIAISLVRVRPDSLQGQRAVLSSLEDSARAHDQPYGQITSLQP